MGEAINSTQFENFVRDHYRFLFLVAFRHLGDTDMAKDVVQDFFLDFWNRRDQIEIQSSLEAYATRSVRYICLALKKKQQLTVSLDENPLEPAAFDGEEELDRLLKNETLRDRLAVAIEKLPTERKRIFELSNREGLTYQQIADRLGISINTVKTQIKKAYAFIREDLNDLTVLAILLSSIKNL